MTRYSSRMPCSLVTDWAHDIDNCRWAKTVEEGAIAALRSDDVAMENMMDSLVGEEWDSEVEN